MICVRQLVTHNLYGCRRRSDNWLSMSITQLHSDSSLWQGHSSHAEPLQAAGKSTPKSDSTKSSKALTVAR
eukprot:scaffold254178_cov18-Prasinocladus_malaysianus.AAC.1